MGAGERRRLIVLCSVAGFLVVVMLAKFTIFNGSGSDASSAALPLPSLTSGAAAATPTTGAPAARSTETPATFDVFATKNPFEPVIIVTPPDGGTTPTSPPPDGGGGGGGSTETTASTAPPSNEPAPGTSVALLDVSQDPDGTSKARVQVGSKVYVVGEGDVFATSYRVVSLDDPCGQFLFGDAPFKLCEGEEVIK